jgi:micrococcal nuclease
MAKLKQMQLYAYLCEVVHVVDGDTVDVFIDMGFYLHQRVRIRLLGVDTPERGHDEWAEATEKLAELIETAEENDKRFWLRTHKTGKYGRWLGTLLSYDKEIAINMTMAERWPDEKTRVTLRNPPKEDDITLSDFTGEG